MPGDDEQNGDGVFAEINITPLTDIFLVLLVIFMVTSSVIVNANGGAAKAGLKVNLPKGGTSDVTPQASDLSIAILSILLLKKEQLNCFPFFVTEVGGTIGRIDIEVAIQSSQHLILHLLEIAQAWIVHEMNQNVHQPQDRARPFLIGVIEWSRREH